MTETLVITVSYEMKDAIGMYAGKHNLTISEVVRMAVSELIDFSDPKPPRTGRPRKYKSAAHRKQVYREREQARKQLVALLLESEQGADHDEAVNELLKELKSE